MVASDCFGDIRKPVSLEINGKENIKMSIVIYSAALVVLAVSCCVSYRMGKAASDKEHANIISQLKKANSTATEFLDHTSVILKDKIESGEYNYSHWN